VIYQVIRFPSELKLYKADSIFFGRYLLDNWGLDKVSYLAESDLSGRPQFVIFEQIKYKKKIDYENSIKR
jgi:hypothetical protein